MKEELTKPKIRRFDVNSLIGSGDGKDDSDNNSTDNNNDSSNNIQPGMLYREFNFEFQIFLYEL